MNYIPFLLIINIINLNLVPCDENEENYYDDKNSLLVFVTLRPSKTFVFDPISNSTITSEANLQNNVLNSTIHLIRTKKRVEKLQTIKFRVVGGKPAVLGEVPWQVALKKAHKHIYKTFCGGSIIGKTKVLSAAHCFREYINKQSSSPSICCAGVINARKLHDIYAVAGTLNTESQKFDEGQWRSLSATYYPQEYEFPNLDICVVKVTFPFEYDSNVHSVLMQTTFEDIEGECLISGYGGINSAFSKNVLQAPKLLTGYVRLLSNKVCTRLMKHANKFVCSVTGTSDVSKGDSGGPLVCMDRNLPKTARLVGVTSGTKQVKTKTPPLVTFFTRVSEYQDFIANQARRVKCQILETLENISFLPCQDPVLYKVETLAYSLDYF